MHASTIHVYDSSQFGRLSIHVWTLLLSGLLIALTPPRGQEQWSYPTTPGDLPSLIAYSK